MVFKYTKQGTPYLEPPYSEEERLYIRKYTAGPPIAMCGSRSDRLALASQPEPAKAKRRRAPKRP
jgi:hypothetical protein